MDFLRLAWSGFWWVVTLPNNSPQAYTEATFACSFTLIPTYVPTADCLLPVLTAWRLCKILPE